MAKIINYDGAEFKCIDCVPEYHQYNTIYVAKEPHVDEKGHSFQVINTNWRYQKIVHPVYDHRLKNGYHHLNLPRLDRDNQISVSLHRLVLLAWQDKLLENYRDLQVNHIDENKSNNRLHNLEFTTAYDNCNWGTRNQRIADAKVKHGKTAGVVAIEIQTKREFNFRTVSECTRNLVLLNSCIVNCLAGRRRQHLGFVFCRQDDYSPAKVDELIARATRRKK